VFQRGGEADLGTNAVENEFCHGFFLLKTGMFVGVSEVPDTYPSFY
jgi:hypothetical protein